MSAAKICPVLEAPQWDIWESYAVLNLPGLRFGQCQSDGSPTSCQDITVERFNEYRSAGDHDRKIHTYRLVIAPQQGFIKDLFLNVTFTHQVAPADAIVSLHH